MKDQTRNRGHQKFLLLTVLVGGLFLLMLRSSASHAHWHDRFADAAATARQADKLLLVDFRADWCGHCRTLETDVLHTRAFAEAADDAYVLAKVDLTAPAAGSEAEKLAQRYRVSGLPTVMILNPEDGSVIARASPQDFSMEGILRFLDRAKPQR